MKTYNDLAEAVKSGKSPDVDKMVKALLAEDEPAKDILNNGLIVGMNEIGVLFKANKVYVPQVMLAARAMYAGLDLINPILAENEVEPLGIVAIGTVKGDMHDIGKNLVKMMMEGAGFKVLDLGTNVSSDKFISAVENDGAQIVAMSALLTTTMLEMKKTIEDFESKGLRDKVKIMIGGAPITNEYAQQISADGYSDDAASAASLAKELLGQL